MNSTLPNAEFLDEIRSCTLCTDLPLGAKPIVQFHPSAKCLIAGQAPGRITHAQGRPFDDPSGNRLRAWLGIDQEIFYDPQKIAIVPMGFCYPGTGKGGDLPPRPECAAKWRKPILATLENIELTLLIGRYALDWHLPAQKKTSVTEIVRNWQEYWPTVLPLPHPSPRNNRWLQKNPWFEAEIVPELQARVRLLLKG